MGCQNQPQSTAAVYNANLNYLQKLHIPELIQNSKNLCSKSSSVTSFVTTDLRHTPQNLWGFMSFSVAVNFHPRCLRQYRHPAIVHAYLQHIKFLDCHWQNILQVIPIVKPTRCTSVSNLFILGRHSTCFGRSFRPSSGVQDCTHSNRYLSNRYCCLLASKQSAVSDHIRPPETCSVSF